MAPLKSPQEFSTMRSSISAGTARFSFIMIVLRTLPIVVVMTGFTLVLRQPNSIRYGKRGLLNHVHVRRCHHIVGEDLVDASLSKILVTKDEHQWKGTSRQELLHHVVESIALGRIWLASALLL